MCTYHACFVIYVQLCRYNKVLAFRTRTSAYVVKIFYNIVQWASHVVVGMTIVCTHARVDKISYQPALAAWRSGHRIRLRNRRPGFESRQGVRFLGKTSEFCYVCILDSICIVCVLKWKGHKNIFWKISHQPLKTGANNSLPSSTFFD
jgi:hypothetical protein